MRPASFQGFPWLSLLPSGLMIPASRVCSEYRGQSCRGVKLVTIRRSARGVPLPTSKKMFFLWDPRIFGRQAVPADFARPALVPLRAVLGERPTQRGLNRWVGGAGSIKKLLPLIGELVSMVTD